MAHRALMYTDRQRMRVASLWFMIRSVCYTDDNSVKSDGIRKHWACLKMTLSSLMRQVIAPDVLIAIVAFAFFQSDLWSREYTQLHFMNLCLCWCGCKFTGPISICILIILSASLLIRPVSERNGKEVPELHL